MAGPDRATTFDGFYENAWIPMVRLATLILSESAGAEDVVQDAFVNVYRRWGKIEREGAETAYLRSAVVNGARSALRCRAAASRRTDKLALRSGLVSTGFERLDDEGEVLSALNSLPRRQREVLVLRYWADLSEDEIANTLSISRGTVKSTAARGLSQLQRRLEGNQ